MKNKRVRSFTIIVTVHACAGTYYECDKIRLLPIGLDVNKLGLKP